MASIDLIRASNGSGDAVKATVANARVISSTTLQVDATTNWPSKFTATVGNVDGTGAFVPATVTVFNGILSGGNIEITSFAPGYTDIGNTPGQIVVLKPTTAWANEVADVLAVTHNQDGTLKDSIVTTTKVANGAITAGKLDFATLAFGNYSTSEVNTGFTWIDGKPIYTKTISYTGNTTSPSVYTFTTGISTIGTIIRAHGHITWAGQPWLTPFPGVYWSDQFYGGYLNKTDKDFKFSRVGNAGYTPTLNLTLEYTKT